MKKFFKTFVIITFGLMALVLVTVGFLFYKLPTAKSLSKAVVEAVQQVTTSNSIEKNKEVLSDNKIAAEDSIETLVEQDEKQIAEDAEMNKKVFDDLRSTEAPMSQFCASLKNSKTGALTQDDFFESVKNSLDTEKQDPRVQAAKPFFKYILRLPKMQEFLNEVENAPDTTEEQGLIDKAKFYSLAYSAFSEMKQHQADVESVLDRGYLFIGLNNLLSKKPELLNNANLQNFCNNTENLFNQSVPVDFDREKKDFLALLAEAGVTAEQIGFDPNYKTKIDFSFSKNALSMQGGWLDDLLEESEDEEVIDEAR